MLCLQQEACIQVGLCDQAPHWGARCDQCDRRWRPHEMASRCLKAPPYGAGHLVKESITGLLQFEQSLMVATEAHVLMCLWRAGPLRKLLEKQPQQTNWRSRCFLTWLRAMSEFSLMTLQYGQKASCLRFPSMLKNCLTRHTCRWKLDSRNSLLEPT